MLRLNKLKQILSNYGLRVDNTGRGKHPFKVKGFILGTQHRHTYPLMVHGGNPEISEVYLKGIIEEFNLPNDIFKK
ncbi:MAG: hypothetical protein AAB116_20115 [Candidatus Poribacteria bacterium]